MAHNFWRKTLFLLLFPIVLFGQAKKSDLTLLTYDEIKQQYFDNEKDSNLQTELANAYLAKAKKDNIAIRKAKGYYLFSLMNTGNKAISYLDSVIKYSKNSNDENFPNSAYCEKADILKQLFKFKEAMNTYLMAEEIAIKNKKDDHYIVKFFIAKTKSEDLGEINEALDMYKECFHYYKNKDFRDSKYSDPYLRILFAIADSYKALQQTDSATYYNRLGYKSTNESEDKAMLPYFVLNEGANQIVKRKFKIALDSINKALPKMIDYGDEANTMASYYYLGKAYEGLGRKDEAANNFIKVDSIYKKTKTIYPELISGYPFLVSYYKERNDKEKQLEYLTTYVAIDADFQKNYKEMYRLIVKRYDIPHLFSEKESLISSLKNQKNQSYWIIIILSFIALLVSVYGYYQRKLNSKYKLRFERIISQSPVAEEPEKIAKTHNNKTEDIGIAEEMVSQILNKLNAFEKNNEYLKSNITIQSLSNEFDTNTKYVSKIVNAYKGKTFVQYINDLRVDYAIIALQENSRLRKYTIQSLGAEFGFNNAESFSAAFFKKTGIKPTFFIKRA